VTDVDGLNEGNGNMGARKKIGKKKSTSSANISLGGRKKPAARLSQTFDFDEETGVVTILDPGLKRKISAHLKAGNKIMFRVEGGMRTMPGGGGGTDQMCPCVIRKPFPPSP
jgi:hypothetical protein